ncbi:PP2C family protein-serine/threonine phosphatase [Candidatus Margulisiibacteriota bacterium]
MPISRTAPVYSLKYWGNRNTLEVQVSPRKNIAAFTDRAGRHENQDGLLVHLNQRKVLAVADGMGGRPSGAIASQTALETVEQAILKNEPMDITVPKAHLNIRNAGLKDHELTGMGTTLLVAEIEGNLAHIFSVGDSRAYLIRPTGEIGLLSVDQNVAGEVYESEVRPVLTFPLREVGEYYTYVRNFPHMRRKYSGNELYSGLGLHEMEIVDSLTRLEAGDRLLLTTDGLNYLPYNIFAYTMQEMLPLEETAVKLAQSSLRIMQEQMLRRDAIGDNITLILYEHQPEN